VKNLFAINLLVIKHNVRAELEKTQTMKYRLFQQNIRYLSITLFLLFLMHPSYSQINAEVTDASCPDAPDGSAVITILNRPLPSEVKCSDGVVVDNVITELMPGNYTATVTDDNGCEGAVEFEVKVNEQQFVINFDISQPNCGAEDGELTATIDWGKAKYQFNWYKDGELHEIDETDDMTSTISGIDEGEYMVEVFDHWGCFTSDSRTVERYNQDPLPIDRIEIKDLICPGDKNGEAEVFVDPDDPRDPSKFTYEWSNGDDTKKIDGLEGGEYTVTVYDEAECWGEASTMVYEPPKLELKIDGDGQFKYCVANHNSDIKAVLKAMGSGGTPPLTYPDGKTRTYKSAGYHCKSFKVVDSENCETRKKGCVLIVKILCSWDPNEIIGEEGYGDDRWMGLDKKIAYTINYENDPDFAFAAAQTVEIKLPIDPSLDIYSLRLDDFGFGGYRFQVPKNTAHYTKRLDLRDSLGLYVDFVAGIDIAKQEAFWRLVSIDPATGMSPKGVDDGFLKINDSTKQGEGFVTFSIQPNPMGSTGDTILAKASIRFDYNDTIGTNTWLNRIDIDPPISQIGDIGPIQFKDSVLIPVTYSDVGSGVKEIDLYYSVDNGPFKFLANLDTGFDNYYFKGEQGIPYKFFSRATDSVGNKEPMKSGADASFTIVEKALSLEHTLAHATCYGASDAKIDLEVSGGLAPYTYIWSNDSTTEDLSNLLPGEYHVLVTDKTGTQIADTFTITQPALLPVDLGGDITLILGEQKAISAPVGYASYLWSNGSTAPSIMVGDGLDTLTYSYSVKVADENGCENSDTILVHVMAPTEIIEISSNTRIEIYPNPTQGMLYLQIQNEGGEDIEVKINDIAGNQIFSENYKNKLNNFNEKIDLSNYPEGNYILTIGQGQSKINKTIIRY
jgi:hypothetical protein